MKVLKLIDDKKVYLDRYIIHDEKLLHQIMRDDDKIFHMLVVPQTLSKYILHQAHNMLGHKDIMLYGYAIMFYWKRL